MGPTIQLDNAYNGYTTSETLENTEWIIDDGWRCAMPPLRFVLLSFIRQITSHQYIISFDEKSSSAVELFACEHISMFDEQRIDKVPFSLSQNK